MKRYTSLFMKKVYLFLFICFYNSPIAFSCITTFIEVDKLTINELRDLPPLEIHNLPQKEVRKFTEEQIQVLTPEQIAVFPFQHLLILQLTFFTTSQVNIIIKDPAVSN